VSLKTDVPRSVPIFLLELRGSYHALLCSRKLVDARGTADPGGEVFVQRDEDVLAVDELDLPLFCIREILRCLFQPLSAHLVAHGLERGNRHPAGRPELGLAVAHFYDIAFEELSSRLALDLDDREIQVILDLSVRRRDQEV
jgi:hypothetical protein